MTMVKKFCLFVCMILVIGAKTVPVAAESAVITFTTEQGEVNEGEEFVVVMSVQGDGTIDSVDTDVSYDSRMISFLSGGKYVSDDSGTLKIRTGKLGGEERSRKFSLKFKAAKAGGSVIDVKGKSNIRDGSGKAMSISSNRLSVTVNGDKEESGTDEEKDDEEADDEEDEVEEYSPPPSRDNNLKSLSIHSGALEPPFRMAETNYSTTVANDVESLFVSAKAADPDALVTIRGNENLIEGDNRVRVVVKAPSGAEKVYRIDVKRETAEETALGNEASGVGGSVLDFNVYENDGKVFLENAYRFQVVDVEEEGLVPAGFVETRVLLYGVNVTAYTMENDLENDYLLIYGVNPNGDKSFYQYDRVEKTLQRYSGDLIERVNQSAVSSKQQTTDEYNSNLNQLAIIIAVVSAICVLLLIAMIKMATKMRGIADFDDLNLR